MNCSVQICIKCYEGENNHTIKEDTFFFLERCKNDGKLYCLIEIVIPCKSIWGKESQSYPRLHSWNCDRERTIPRWQFFLSSLGRPNGRQKEAAGNLFLLLLPPCSCSPSFIGKKQLGAYSSLCSLDLLEPAPTSNTSGRRLWVDKLGNGISLLRLKVPYIPATLSVVHRLAESARPRRF